MNSSELRAKIKSILQTELSTCDSLYDDISDRILALLPPPATAKLPEGVVVCAMPDGRYHVRGCGWWLLKQGRWEKMTLPTHEYPGEFVSHDDALTAALSAPPVPGESKATPTHDDYHALKFCLAREQDESAALRKVRDFLNARISELEAENERLKAQYDMVEQERTRLMLGQQVPYTPAEKPDARKVAPNGRAMARYELCGPNREYNMHGIDDEGHDWAWAHDPGMWIEPFPACMDSRRTLCTFDGTPTPGEKPDPLARAVTVGEMLRLAEHYDRCDHGDHALMVRAIFDEHRGGR